MWSSAAGTTSKVLLVPCFPSLPVVVMTMALWARVMATLPDQTPALKLPVVVGLMVLVLSVSVAVST